MRRDFVVPKGALVCPASMCPLIAPDGSPWNGRYGSPCYGTSVCHYWSVTCDTGGIQKWVEEAAANGGHREIVGPNKPRRGLAKPREYDCPHAAVCRWQERAEREGRALCPPRDALMRGIDPRVCAY